MLSLKELNKKIDCATVYAFSTLKPDRNGRDLWAYVGQTKRPLAVRYEEHLRKQPWSDLYPEIRILKQMKNCRVWQVLLVEWYYIKRYKPLYNDKHNYGNKNRIPGLVAKQQRTKRDKGLM